MNIDLSAAAYGLAVLLHVTLFAYWLGADLGVFYASRFVLRSDLPMESRMTASAIQRFLDTSVRVSLVLVLPSGASLLTMAGGGRNGLTRVSLAIIWVFSLAWLALVLVERKLPGSGPGDSLRRIDGVIRAGLVVLLLALAIAGLVGASAMTHFPWWINAKIGVYALCVAAGLALRLRGGPFRQAWQQLRLDGSTPEVEKTLQRRMSGSMPFVYAIWVLILVAAFLGIVKSSM